MTGRRDEGPTSAPSLPLFHDPDHSHVTDLSDHGSRADHDHHHDHGHHGDDDADGDLTDNPIWQQENVILTSVGIDIGSSGTQVVCSQLWLRRAGSTLSPRYTVVHREPRYVSPVGFTPFTDDGSIDAAGVGSMVDAAYRAARLTPDLVDTGVVILTGEALRRQNAERLAEVVAATAGDFVVAAAGHHLEATLAAHGSGTVALSAAGRRVLLNIDIGGGTTKLSVVADGIVRSTAAVHIGGRLVVVGPDGVVTRLEPAGAQLAAEAGTTLVLGDAVTPGALDCIAEHMADRLVAILDDPQGTAGDWLVLTDPVEGLDAVTAVTVSGGVGEYVHGTEQRDFGDLGRRLGHAIVSRLATGAIRWPLLAVTAPIRATVLGASEFSVQLSGSTWYASDVEVLLPMRNVPVVRPSFELGTDVEPDVVAGAVRQAMARIDADGVAGDVVVAVAWSGAVTHARVAGLARGLAAALDARSQAGRPMLIAVDGDIGRNLGAILRDEVGVPSEVLVVDGIDLQELDYIDIGRPRPPSNAAPVTIKSLVFAMPPASAAGEAPDMPTEHRAGTEGPAVVGGQPDGGTPRC